MRTCLALDASEVPEAPSCETACVGNLTAALILVHTLPSSALCSHGAEASETLTSRVGVGESSGCNDERSPDPDVTE